MKRKPKKNPDDRIANRRAAMKLARDQAMRGDPICGAFFAFESLTRQDINGAFMADFYDVDFEDESDECRPY